MSDPMLGEIKAVGFPWCPYGYAFANGQLMQVQQNAALYSLYGVYFGGNGQTTFGLPNLQSRVGVALATNGSTLQGLTPYQLGNSAGAQAIQLSLAQLPAHNHAAASNATATTTVTPTTTVTTSIAGLSATTTINALTAPASLSAIPTGNLLSVGQTAGSTPVAIKPYAPSGTATTLAGGAATTTLSGNVTASAATTATAATTVGVTTTIGVTGTSAAVDIRPPLVALNYIVATIGVYPQRN
ncbi:MAG: tail fiber protein [Candidatus Didemnitutus sp.]|nr:tail fiber protein [Candidatus Didemnitutus sp.]